MQFSTVAALSALSASAMAAYTNGTTVTTDVTVTGYTTYCPASTVVTITKCHEDKCAPTVITVSEETTLTITEPCVVPTTYTTEVATKSKTVAAESTHATVSSYEGAGAKNAAGVVAGVAAVAAALL